MTPDEERAVAALTRGMGRRRRWRGHARPSRPASLSLAEAAALSFGGGGAAFGTPAFMKPPPDPAAQANRIATGAEGPGGANHDARVQGLIAGGKVPAEAREEPPTGDPLQDAVRDYERSQQQQPLFLDSPANAPAPPAPLVQAGMVNALALVPKLFELALGVHVAPASTQDELAANIITGLTSHLAEHGPMPSPGAGQQEGFEVPELLRIQADERARDAQHRGPSTPASRGGRATSAERTY
jgi:hypothetical protein